MLENKSQQTKNSPNHKHRDNQPKRRRGSRDSRAPKDSKGPTGHTNSKDHSSRESKQNQSLLIQFDEDCTAWYEIASKTAGRNDLLDNSVQNKPNLDKEMLQHFRKQADDLFEKEKEIFRLNRNQSRSSDDDWVQNTTRHGTLKDRVAAMSVMIADNPVHQLNILDQLMQLSQGGAGGQQKQRMGELAGQALTDLFLNTYLPPHRKLISMSSRPLHKYYFPANNVSSAKNANNSNTPYSPNTPNSPNTPKTANTLSPRVLLLWRFEEYVKQRYSAFLALLSTWLNDQQESHKLFALKTTIQLLTDRPEAEQLLLQMAVNKLGDPSKKMTAAASHQLRHMIHINHPAMTPVVAKEVQQLAFRPHISPKVLYNCVIFLNQLKLHKATDHPLDQPHGQDPLPVALVKTYFRLFEVVVLATSPEAVAQAEKLAIKRKKIKRKNQNKPIDARLASTNLASTKALKSAPGTKATMQMKARLLSALLTGVNRAHPYLPSSYQSMEKHMDALYRLVHQAPPSASTQALMLLFHLVIGSNPNPNIPHTKAQSIPAPPLSSQQQKAIDRYYRVLYAKLSESTMLAGGKHLTMLFNLIYKSLKYDNNQTRITAFIKRLLQVAFHSRTTPPILAASLFLISEIIPSHPYLKTISINQNVPFKLDVNSRDPNRAFVPTHSNHASSDANSDTCTEVNAIANADTCTEADTSRTQNNASLWELSLSASHFHPSVVKFAESVLTTDEGVQYKGDPLKDFSLGPFLDRFAYRHPKERLAKKDEDSTDKLLSVADTRKKRADDILRNRVLVNDPSFLASKNVPEELRFFRQYFEQRAKNDQIKETSAHVNPKPKDNIADSDQELMDSQHVSPIKSFFSKTSIFSHLPLMLFFTIKDQLG